MSLHQSIHWESLFQDNKEGKEHAVYYLSRTLTEVERKYSAIERLCFALYFTVVKLRHYMLPFTIYIIAKTDLISSSLPWKLYFDGSKTDLASWAGIVLEDPLRIKHCYSFQLDFQCTNNKAEYEALIIGLEILVKLGIQYVEILGDSMLILRQIAGEYKCLSLAIYLVAARNLLVEFREATWEHIPREENFAANKMAQIAIRVQMPEDCVQRIIKVGKKSLPSVLNRGMEIDVNTAIMTKEDCTLPIINYL
ncbi:hypothetical protein L3X38_010206 [Prunus dulcis]|uniref:RNase H type-1 domain-containing protein n=1 Tax=Prunus dulcis TaxID=3755 RepID=A0AAD4WHI0_PRUDU|nr:hypothetical protein L3X38_010206 [Prunus dulcis]